MPTIINITYFKNDLAIPQAIEQPSIINEQSTNIDALTDCIVNVEEDLLLNALGLEIYNDLKSAITNLDIADQKWKDLVNGVEYDGKKWDGLANQKSLIAYAVYCVFLDENSSFWTTLGIEKPKSENSSNATPAFKIATAHQKFIRKYQSDACETPYRSFFGGASFTDYFGTNSDVQVSLFHYLRDKKDIYGWEDSKFKFYRPINSFGI